MAVAHPLKLTPKLVAKIRSRRTRVQKVTFAGSWAGFTVKTPNAYEIIQKKEKRQAFQTFHAGLDDPCNCSQANKRARATGEQRWMDSRSTILLQALSGSLQFHSAAGFAFYQFSLFRLHWHHWRLVARPLFYFKIDAAIRAYICKKDLNLNRIRVTWQKIC